MKRYRKTIAACLNCLLGALFYAYINFLLIEPSIMVPQLMRHYQIAAASVGTLVALFYYAYTPLQILVGLLVDRFGARRLLLIALSICVLGSFVFAVPGPLYLAGIGRFLIGAGAAFAFVGALKLVTNWLPTGRFAFFTGVVLSLGLLGAIAADVLSTFLEKTDWHLLLLYSAIFGLALLLLMWLFLRDYPADSDTAERMGPVSFLETFVGLMRILKNAQIWIAGAIGFFLYMPTIVFGGLWGIPFLGRVYHYQAGSAALLISMIFWGWLIGTPIVGWVSDRVRLRQIPMSIGAITSALCFAIVLYVPDLSRHFLAFLLFVFGFSSSVTVLCFAISRESGPPKAAATAIAFTYMWVMIGGNLFLPLVGLLLDVGWQGAVINHVHIYPVRDYLMTLSVLPASLIVAALLSFSLRETYCRQRTS